MTRVDFYILDAGEPLAALHYACRLLEKAYRSGHHSYVHCEDAEQARQLDTLLWQFRDEAFVPHSLTDDSEPVLIGHQGQPGRHCDVLVNLSQRVPEAFSRFQRLAEIVCQDSDWLAASRQRYSFYKHRGYPMHTHSISR